MEFVICSDESADPIPRKPPRGPKQSEKLLGVVKFSEIRSTIDGG